MRRLRIPAAVLSVALATTSQASASIVFNGSFEDGTGVPATVSFTTLSAVSTAIPGWTVTTGSIDWIGYYWAASDGYRSLDLSGTSQGPIVQQTLNVVAGNRYLLEFDMAGNPDGLPIVKSLQVSVGDQLEVDFSFDKTGKTETNMGWETKSLEFVATANTTLQFSDLSSSDNNSYGSALDNVRVTAVVPEPATLAIWSLLGAAGAGAAALRRRANRWSGAQRSAIRSIVNRRHA